jgi:hypothetical protein
MRILQERMAVSVAIGALEAARPYAGESRVLAFLSSLLCCLRDGDKEGFTVATNKIVELM